MTTRNPNTDPESGATPRNAPADALGVDLNDPLDDELRRLGSRDREARSAHLDQGTGPLLDTLLAQIPGQEELQAALSQPSSDRTLGDTRAPQPPRPHQSTDLGRQGSGRLWLVAAAFLALLGAAYFAVRIGSAPSDESLQARVESDSEPDLQPGSVPAPTRDVSLSAKQKVQPEEQAEKARVVLSAPRSEAGLSEPSTEESDDPSERVASEGLVQQGAALSGSLVPQLEAASASGSGAQSPQARPPISQSPAATVAVPPRPTMADEDVAERSRLEESRKLETQEPSRSDPAELESVPSPARNTQPERARAESPAPTSRLEDARVDAFADAPRDDLEASAPGPTSARWQRLAVLLEGGGWPTALQLAEMDVVTEADRVQRPLGKQTLARAPAETSAGAASSERASTEGAQRQRDETADLRARSQATAKEKKNSAPSARQSSDLQLFSLEEEVLRALAEASQEATKAKDAQEARQAALREATSTQASTAPSPWTRLLSQLDDLDEEFATEVGAQSRSLRGSSTRDRESIATLRVLRRIILAARDLDPR